MVIYVSVDENGLIDGWGSSSISLDSVKVEINEDHPFLEDIPNKYQLKDGKIERSPKAQEIENSILRKSKKEQLSNECNQDILNGFYYIIDDETYQFGYDEEDQANFQERWLLFQNGMVDRLRISARKDGEPVRLEFNKEQFENLYLRSVQVKEQKISKLKDELYPLIDSLQHAQEIEAITWDSEVIEPTQEPIEITGDNTLDKEIERVKVDNASSSGELLNLIFMLGSGGM